MAKQFQFDRVKDFMDGFHVRAEGTLWINGVKNSKDLKRKFKSYDVNNEFGNLRVDDDNCGSQRLRFTRKSEPFQYLLDFREKENDVQLEPNR